MSAFRIPTFLLTLASLASLAPTAAGFIDGVGGYGNPFWSKVGPFNTNSTEWLQAVSESNSTGLFNIPGYDVSQAYPGQPMNGWTLSVAAVDVESESYYEPYDERLVGYSMTIQAPDKLIKSNTDGTKIVNVHSSWGMCAWYWNDVPDFTNTSWYNSPENKPLAQNGSCTGFLTDACIAALEKQAATSYSIYNETSGPFGSHVACDRLFTPKECGEYVGNFSSPIRTYEGIPIAYLNGSVTNQSGWSITANDTAQDLKAMWDSMVLEFWPIMTVFVSVDDGSDSESAAPGLAQLSCISPNGIGTEKVFSFARTIADGNQTGSQTGNQTDGQSGAKNGAGLTKAALKSTFWISVALVALLL